MIKRFETLKESEITNKINSLKPTYFSLKNPKYIEVDRNYISTLIIVDYAREYSDIIFKELINNDFNIQMSINYEKIDKYGVIKKITYYIGNSGATIKEKSENSQDLDIVKSSFEDAKFIRKKLQVDNEELYNLNVYITIIEKNKKTLEYQIERIKGICMSYGIITRTANYRQDEAYNLTMPVFIENSKIQKFSKRNVLGSSLVSTYPFILSTINDENGILYRKNS